MNAPKNCNTACWVAEANHAWTAHGLTATVPPDTAAIIQADASAKK